MESNKSKAFRIAIWGSGNGSNAEEIIQHFKKQDGVEVGLIVSNKKAAYILERAKLHDIPTLYVTRRSLHNSEELIGQLKSLRIDLHVLAGFLLKIPPYLVEAYPNKIINIHPALLPKYGGKGMYGIYVHEAVQSAQEKKSGMTVHYVNENYDEGDIIAQYEVAIDPDDSSYDIAAKVQKLEHAHYAEVIDDLITELRKSD